MNKLNCHTCSNRRSIPGDCHISCVNPPPLYGEMSNASEEKIKEAQEMILKVQEGLPEAQVLFRCTWGRCGIFPLAYDPNTILACTNHNVAPP